MEHLVDGNDVCSLQSHLIGRLVSILTPMMMISI